jgi:hypothetical protein
LPAQVKGSHLALNGFAQNAEDEPGLLIAIEAVIQNQTCFPWDPTIKEPE